MKLSLKKLAKINEKTGLEFSLERDGTIRLGDKYLDLDRVWNWVIDWENKGYDCNVSNLTADDRWYWMRSLGVMCA